MSRDDSSRIADILAAIEKCEKYAQQFTNASSIELKSMVEDAIERNLLIIGEAVTHLSPEFIEAHPDIAWSQIRGLRNILVHEYFGVDMATIRDVVTNYLPPLAEYLRNL